MYLVQVSDAHTSTVCRRTMSHGDAVTVEQIRQPLLSGRSAGVPLKKNFKNAERKRLA